jgi:hypothetical protein
MWLQLFLSSNPNPPGSLSTSDYRFISSIKFKRNKVKCPFDWMVFANKQARVGQSGTNRSLWWPNSCLAPGVGTFLKVWTPSAKGESALLPFRIAMRKPGKTLKLILLKNLITAPKAW